MYRFHRIRRRALSLRGGIALTGAIAVALSAAQGAGTLAAPAATRTATLPIASANYFPTPLPGSISCSNNYSPGGVNTGAVVSWASVPGMKYRFVVRRDSADGQIVRDTFETTTSVRYRGNHDGSITWDDYYVQVHSVNIDSGSSDPLRVQSSGYVSYRLYSSSDLYTACSSSQAGVSNQSWENSTSWTPGDSSFAVAPSVEAEARAVPAAQDAVIEEGRAVDATPEEAALEGAALEGAGLETTTVAAPRSRPAATTTATSTSRSAPRTSSSASPTTAPAVKPSTSSSSTSTPATTSAQSSSTASSTATPTATTVPATATQLALPGGGEAELVGGTTLVVTDAEGAVCTAKVRAGSTLKERSGELEVTDAVETRVVDQETCELT